MNRNPLATRPIRSNRFLTVVTQSTDAVTADQSVFHPHAGSIPHCHAKAPLQLAGLWRARLDSVGTPGRARGRGEQDQHQTRPSADALRGCTAGRIARVEAHNSSPSTARVLRVRAPAYF